MPVTESILDSVKEDLGVMTDPDTEAPFDGILIRDINSVLGLLWQLGVGPSTPFKITGSTETWSDFHSDVNMIEPVRSYVSKKVKQLFDPPTSGPLIEAEKRITDELEWRLNVMSETP